RAGGGRGRGGQGLAPAPGLAAGPVAALARLAAGGAGGVGPAAVSGSQEEGCPAAGALLFAAEPRTAGACSLLLRVHDAPRGPGRAAAPAVADAVRVRGQPGRAVPRPG